MNRIPVAVAAGGMLLGAWLLYGTAACAEKPAASSEEPAASTAPVASEEVLATVGSRPITEAEVAEVVSGDLLKVEQQRYQILANGLQQRIDQVLQELEAEAQDVSVEELFEREVTAKVTAPTDADVDLFYEQNKARINQPKEQIAPTIRAHLEEQGRRQARGEWLSALRDKYEVTTLLEPFRIPIEDDGFPALGPEDAPVTIVEFSDFECPYCSRIAPTLKQVAETYGEKVRFVFRQFPLNIHPNAQKAAEASLCADEQGKFWEMHDLMFAEQRQLGVEQLKEKATRLELDAEAFNACLDSGKYVEEIRADLEAGSAAGVSGTPAMFVNGRAVSGAVPYEQIAAIVDEELDRAGESVE